MQVDIQQAETQLARLIELIERGETVVIAREGQPVAELVPVRRHGIPFGIASADPIAPPGDRWWQPLSDQEAEDWIAGS